MCPGIFVVTGTLNSKKKLLILIEWFSPGYKAGGPIQSCVNLCAALKDRYNIFVLTTDTDHGETTPYPGITGDQWMRETNLGIQIYYATKRTLRIKRFYKVLNEVEADIIYLNLLFSPQFVLYPLWLKFIGKIKASVILCPRGTLYNSAISSKWYKKKPLLRLMKWMGIHRQITFHATNEREYKAVSRYFPASKIIIADNLPATIQPPYSSCLKEAGSIRCIFIARIVPIKNLLYLLHLLQGLTENIMLTIAGPVEDKSYWQQCTDYITRLPANIKVHYTGPKRNADLLFLLQQHHLFILPTTGENFGHAIFESLLAGRPVLISDQTPWSNLAIHKAGWGIPLSMPIDFAGVIKTVAGFHQQAYDEYANGAWTFAHNFINNPRLKQPYYHLFND